MDLQTPRFLLTSSLSRSTRRTALRSLTAGGLAAGLFGAVGLRGSAPATRAAQDGTPSAAQSWRLSGTAMEACRCAVTRPRSPAI